MASTGASRHAALTGRGILHREQAHARDSDSQNCKQCIASASSPRRSCRCIRGAPAQPLHCCRQWLSNRKQMLGVAIIEFRPVDMVTAEVV